MKVKSSCYPLGVTGAFTTVYLRLNSKIEPAGDLAGTSLSYALRADVQPKLIFLLEEHVPVIKNVYIVSAAEGYRVTSLESTDTVTQTAIAVALRPDELLNYTPPNPD